MPDHRDTANDQIHVPHFRTYVDEAARVAAPSADFTDGLPPIGDLRKWAYQESDDTLWVLVQIDPSVIWNQIGGSGGSPELPFDAVTDPAMDAAVTTAIIDINSGTVITLTAASNSQTLQAPTDTAAGRKFFVLNNDTSNNALTVNGIALSPGQYAEFRWDETAWLLTTGGAAAGPGGLDTQIQYNDGGVLAGDPNHTWDKTNKTERVLGDIEQTGGETGNLYTPVQVSATPVGANPRFSVVQANFLYVCDANDNDLRIYDVTDPEAPALIGSLVIGGGRGLDIAGRFLYYTDEDNGGRLVIVDVIDKSNPVVVGSVVTGGAPRGVKVRGKFAFVTYNTGADGLRSFDVTDPTAPILLDSFNLASPGRTDFDIDAAGETIALPGSSNLQLVDISDPSNLTAITFVSGNAQSAKYQGRYLYTAREDTPEQFEIYDVASNPSSPTLVGSLALVVPSSVRAISVSGNYAYMVDASNNDMLVIDISDPTAPAAISTAVSVGENPIALTTVGRYAYVLDNNGDQFLIFDVGGIDAQNLNVGNIDAGNINLRKDLKMGGVLSASGGTFGSAGLNSDGPIAAEGRTLGGASKNVVEMFSEEDFPDVGGLIKPDPGVTYQVMQPITITKKIAHPTTVSGFDPAVIRTDAKYANIVTVNVASGSFLETASGAGQLVLQNIRFESDGVVPFAIVSGASQTSLLTELDDCDLVNFAAGTEFNTCTFNANNATFWTGNGVFKFTDCECNWEGMFTANFSDSGVPTADVRSAPGTSQPSFFNIRNAKLSSQANEAFFMLHSNLIAGSTIRINGVEASPFTPGTGPFFDTQTISITSLADSGGAPGVRTVCNAAGHNVADGDTVVHSGFTTETQLNGTFVASDVVDGVSYEVVAVFSGTDTGVSSNASLDGSSPLITGDLGPGQASIRFIGSYLVDGNTTATTFAGNDIWTDADFGGNTVAASNIERFTLVDTTTGELRYDGIEPFSGQISFDAYVMSTGGAQDFKMRVVKNGAVLPDTFEPVLNIAADTKVFSISVPVMLVNGDLVRPQMLRVSGTSSLTASHLSMEIS